MVTGPEDREPPYEDVYASLTRGRRVVLSRSTVYDPANLMAYSPVVASDENLPTSARRLSLPSLDEVTALCIQLVRDEAPSTPHGRFSGMAEPRATRTCPGSTMQEYLEWAERELVNNRSLEGIIDDRSLTTSQK